MELHMSCGAMAMADVGCHLPWYLCALPSGPALVAASADDKKRSKYSFLEHSHFVFLSLLRPLVHVVTSSTTTWQTLEATSLYVPQEITRPWKPPPCMCHRRSPDLGSYLLVCATGDHNASQYLCYPLLSKQVTFWDACHRCSVLFTCVQCVARCFIFFMYIFVHSKIIFWKEKTVIS